MFRSALLSLTIIPLTAYAEVNETFHCRGLLDLFSDEISLIATVNEDRKTGTIQVAGTMHETMYSVEGIERRWSWEISDDGEYRYALFISPDGGGAFYDFDYKDSDGLTEPSDFFFCDDKRPNSSEPQRTEYEHTHREAEVPQGVTNQESESLETGATTDLTAYQFALAQKVMRNWARPSSAQAGLDCLVQVRQSATGAVLSARVVSCNGDAAVERSIEAAVYKASPLPLPDNRLLFDPNVRFRFIPEQ